MPVIVIRPTLKFIKMAYLVILILVGAAFAIWISFAQTPWWAPAFGALLFLWPLARQVRRSAAKATITDDRLRYETGILSKSTRTIQLPKVQDVRVDQTLWQRMFRVGNVSIETAGEASRLTLVHIDSPQDIADLIMERSHGSAAGHASHL
ncbi:MAG TPA: PH domain-containing protein [Bryobacteraceae bacterium]|nr:PH domain-containing protein [Bryobacteraceae bacterium]